MWIKVCGIRETSTAVQIANIGVDAIGLNFFARSPRVVTVNEAAKISDSLPANVARVGVFVNHSIAEVTSISRQCRLDYVQLHGDESPAVFVELQDKLPGIRLIRAWRMKGDGLTELSRFLEECDRYEVQLSACLIDAHVDGIYGGSGKTVPWNTLQTEYDRKKWPPLILAGGLNPTNIKQAIAASNPSGVDVASGVESSPGNKDLELIRQFVKACKSDRHPETVVTIRFNQWPIILRGRLFRSCKKSRFFRRHSMNHSLAENSGNNGWNDQRNGAHVERPEGRWRLSLVNTGKNGGSRWLAAETSETMKKLT